MKPEDLDAAMRRPDYFPAAPEPAPYSPVGAPSQQVIDEAALAYARRWKLDRGDGTFKCSTKGCDGDATLPTLECEACLRRRTGA
jgi:hypothetical protein